MGEESGSTVGVSVCNKREKQRVLYSVSNTFLLFGKLCLYHSLARTDIFLNLSDPRCFLGRSSSHLFWKGIRVKAGLT